MTLQNCIFCVVLLAISVTAVPLLEGRDQQKEVSRTFDDALKQSMTASLMFTLIIIGLIVLIMELYQALFDQIELKTLGNYDYNYEEYDYDYDYDYASEKSSYSSYSSRSLKDSLTNLVLNSIDPVNKSFSFMEIDEEVCRNKAVCEVSSIPWIATFVRYMSPTVRGLEKYKEAVDAGEALEDCSLLFAECKDTLL